MVHVPTSGDIEDGLEGCGVLPGCNWPEIYALLPPRFHKSLGGSTI